MTIDTETGEVPERRPVSAMDYLRSRTQWVAWKYKQRSKGGKPTKPPINPHNGRTASVSDPATWGTYEQATERSRRDNLAGVGYVLTADDNLAGGDLDHVRDATTGELVTWALEIVNFEETYCEVSPSGTGLRFFWIGKPDTAIKNDAQQVEIYGVGRYLTVTGNRLPNSPDEIRMAPFTRDALMARAAVLGNGNGRASNGSNGHTHVEDAFDQLNTAALQNLQAWVPELFGDKAKPSSKGGYRVPSKELGRELEEDVSITPVGIVDFGVADQGDERQGRRTPITLVMEHNEVPHDDAVTWLCDKLGVDKPGILLNPDLPFEIAVAWMKSRFHTEDNLPILHRYRNDFWIWRGNRFYAVDNEEFEKGLWRFLAKALKRGRRGAQPFAPKGSNVRDALSALRSVSGMDPFIQIPTWLKEKDMPPATEFLACANGLLHVPTQMMYQPTPDFFCTSSSTVRYDEDAPPPEHWLRFLDQTLHDPDSIQLAQEWIGYLLTPDTSQQKILYCEGPRRSGKGTLARVITALLGSDSVAGPTLSSLGESFGLEPLITKPCGIVSDARIGSHTNKPAVVERLLSISGEDSISVNRKNKSHWEGRLPTRFIIMTNETPLLQEGSGALVGRMLGLIFKESFYGREDTELTPRLVREQELSGILNWAIEGYTRVRGRGRFVQPQAAEDHLDEMEMLGAPVKAFIRDKCILAPGHRVHTDILYDRYKAWCEANGCYVNMKATFSKNVRTAYPAITIRGQGTDGRDGRFYIGVGLQPASGNSGTQTDIPF